MSTTNSFKATLKNLFKNRIFFNKSLKSFSGFKTGGAADILIFPKTIEELEKISNFCKNEGLPITIIGDGTNILIPDEGIRGITLISAFQEIKIIKNKTLVNIGSGLKKETVLNWCIDKELSGFEFSAGIPGTIGGGIYMNAGIHSKSFSDILEKINLYDFTLGPVSIPKEKMSFSYRSQNFIKNSFIISATFKLCSREKNKIQNDVYLLIEERKRKHPLDYPSCGSTFKNPPNSSAAYLIEKAGLKGKKIRGAQISLKHSNFIINTGTATSSDIQELIEYVQTKIEDKFGIRLETEIIILNSKGMIS